MAFVSESSSETGAIRSVALLTVAVASLQAYARQNWTGPPSTDLGGPFDISARADVASYGSVFLDSLQIDGEPAYELLHGVGYLWMGCALLGLLPASSNGGSSDEIDCCSPLAGGCSLCIWRARCAFMWQLSLAEASERGMGQSPWLFKTSVHDLVGTAEVPGPLTANGFLSSKEVEAVRSITLPVLDTWRDPAGKLKTQPGPPTILTQDVQASLESSTTGVSVTSSVSNIALCKSEPTIRSALLAEFCYRLNWYGRTKDFDQMLEAACSPMKFSYEITGVLGIKRKYQVQEFAQLVVKTTTGIVKAPNDDQADRENKLPENLKLLEIDDMTDILEGARFSKTLEEEERAKLETPLTAAEQIILLTKASHVWATSNTSDEMTLYTILALAQRVLCTFDKPEDCGEKDGLMHTANWLTFSCGLFYRCRAEHHRNKTVERAGFQLQALVDQYNDEKPSAAHRLLLVHGAGYPVRFHQQRELGLRMMRIGMVSSAFEQFKKLHMWPDAIDCLMVAGRKAECLDLVNDLIKTHPSPRLYCALGDIETEHALENYQKAWEFSGHRYARAARSMGRHYFSKHEYPEAIKWFLVAVQINPLHQSIWFACGVAQMRINRFDDAALSFSRCVGVEEENSEAWANLGATHIERGDFRQARACMSEACRRARQNWRMWESFIGVCMKLRDIQGMINGMRRLVELEQAPRIEEKMLGMITSAVLNDAEGLYEGTTGKKFAPKLLDFFKFMTSRCASVPCYWYFLGELQLFYNQPEAALESRLSQARAEQAKLWVEADPEKFARGLSDLISCFEAISESLEDPDLREQAASHLQPCAYSVRNAEKQLQAKLDKCVQVPEAWAAAHAKLCSIATLAEKNAAEVEPSPDGGYPA